MLLLTHEHKSRRDIEFKYNQETHPQLTLEVYAKAHGVIMMWFNLAR